MANNLRRLHEVYKPIQTCGCKVEVLEMVVPRCGPEKFVVRVTKIADPRINGEFWFDHELTALSRRKECVDLVMGLGQKRTVGMKKTYGNGLGKGKFSHRTFKRWASM